MTTHTYTFDTAVPEAELWAQTWDDCCDIWLSYIEEATLPAKTKWSMFALHYQLMAEMERA